MSSIPTVGSNKYIQAPVDQVCSLELSVKLRVLGCPQNSYWYWQVHTSLDTLPSLLYGNRFPEDEWVTNYAAYTLGDLALLLNKFDNKEVNANAKLLIFLKENELNGKN